MKRTQRNNQDMESDPKTPYEEEDPNAVKTDEQKLLEETGSNP